VKITNKHLLDQNTLNKIEMIWLMPRDQLWDLVDYLWTTIPDADSYEKIQDFYGKDLEDAIQNRFQEYAREEERERYATVTVDDVEYKTIDFFDMYHLGWECDTKGFLVEKDGKQVVVLTNHGNPYFADIESLKKKVKELNANVKALKSIISSVEVNG
jgi:hypothetical protein